MALEWSLQTTNVWPLLFLLTTLQWLPTVLRKTLQILNVVIRFCVVCPPPLLQIALTLSSPVLWVPVCPDPVHHTLPHQGIGISCCLYLQYNSAPHCLLSWPLFVLSLPLSIISSWKLFAPDNVTIILHLISHTTVMIWHLLVWSFDLWVSPLLESTLRGQECCLLLLSTLFLVLSYMMCAEYIFAEWMNSILKSSTIHAPNRFSINYEYVENAISNHSKGFLQD